MARTPAKLCQNAFQTIPNVSFVDVKIFFIDENFGSKNRFFVNFVGFWRSNSQMDLAINFYVKFCSRTTDPEVCTTEDR